MRRRLLVGAAALTATLLVAFVVPLAFAVQRLAANGPLNQAEQVARSLATAVALSADPAAIEAAVAAAQAGTPAVLTVFLPGGETRGAAARRDRWVDHAFAGAAFAAEAPGAHHVLVPTRTAQGDTAVVRATLDPELLSQGVAQSWLLLGGLAVVLLAVVLVVADRLARSVVRPSRAAAATARRLATGDLTARAVVEGPPEITEMAGALNHLAARITDLLAAERERVADMSHRLRTPLTALRLDAEGVRDAADRERLVGDVDAVEDTVSALIREARQPHRGPASEPVDLVAVVRDRAEYWGALADEHGRPWALSCDHEHVAVTLRREDLEAVVDVLLDNVFSHTPDRTAYRISVTDAVVVVEDDGGGFAAPQMPQRGVSGAGSTGLGLDIVRQIVEGAGGRVAFGSSPAGGARVELDLGAVAVA